LSRDEQAEVAVLLARKAQEDATAVREFGENLDIAWLKAVMARRGIPQAHIHDIDRLLQLLEDDGATLPDFAERLDELTIYTVPLRYDDLLDAEPLDRKDTAGLVEQTEAWARRELEQI
jgi:HEPN domain-containing protein